MFSRVLTPLSRRTDVLVHSLQGRDLALSRTQGGKRHSSKGSMDLTQLRVSHSVKETGMACVNPRISTSKVSFISIAFLTVWSVAIFSVPAF